MIINYLICYIYTTYCKRKGNAINIKEILYRFIINSSVIYDRVVTVLLSHSNGDYNEPDEVLICQML